MQSPSFLAHQPLMRSHKGRDNAAGLFGIERIPCDNQIRNLLDPVPAAHVFGTFDSVHGAPPVAGALESYQCFEGGFLLALDGTEYFSSQKIHCRTCCHPRVRERPPCADPAHDMGGRLWTRPTHKDGNTTYYHAAVLPMLVAPGHGQVLPLAPEFIRPQDGHDKQDCENAARWMTAHPLKDDAVAVTLLGDDLYCNQPMCEATVSHRFHFIFVCKRSSHFFTLRLG